MGKATRRGPRLPNFVTMPAVFTGFRRAAFRHRLRAASLPAAFLTQGCAPRRQAFLVVARLLPWKTTELLSVLACDGSGDLCSLLLRSRSPGQFLGERAFGGARPPHVQLSLQQGPAFCALF